MTNLGAIGKLVGGEIDFAETSLANEPAEGVVSDCPELL